MKRSLLCALALLIWPHAPARAIEDGFAAEPCAWREVVRLVAGQGAVPVFDGPSTIVCSGVYIGGALERMRPADQRALARRRRVGPRAGRLHDRASHRADADLRLTTPR